MRVDMPIKRITPERLDWIIEALIARQDYPTISHTAIAKELGIPRPTIIRWLNRYYVDRPKQGNLIFGVKKPKPQS
ncbi:unnamed protein product [marine sediment metagenome]|uniref:Uncharacterized protein n=1 Tax=marine sediment metagenome TaxID=412755 RepID=X1QYI9_9ZZZZ